MAGLPPGWGDRPRRRKLEPHFFDSEPHKLPAEESKNSISDSAPIGQPTGTYSAPNRHLTGTHSASNRHLTGTAKSDDFCTTGTHSAPIRHLTGTPSPKLTDTDSLVGIQRDILVSLVDNCRRMGGRITDQVYNWRLANDLNSTPGGIKTAIQRLCARGFLKRVRSKSGSGGWATYEVSEAAYEAFVSKNSISDPAPNRNLQRARDTGGVINNSLAFFSAPPPAPPLDWRDEIAFAGVKLPDFGRRQITRLWQAGLPQAVVQRAIAMWSFDLQYCPERFAGARDLIGVFMGAMLTNGRYEASEICQRHFAKQFPDYRDPT